MTYHSLYQDDDVKKTFISSHSVEDPYSSSEKSKEKPKVALGTRISWLHPLVHLLPVFATAAVVQLTFRGVYWADESRYYKDWQTILQFPAKVHELLIVGSLSAMVLHIFRRMLISSNGIPLGLMVGAFQMGSAEYLFSKSYWKPFVHSLHSLNNWRHRQLKTFLVALALGSSIVYSFLVGPASAAALLPNLGWWEMHKPFNNSLPLKSYISRNSSELYPTALQASSINEICLTEQYWNLLDCPAGGFSALRDWAWTRSQEGYWYNVTDSQHYNPTMMSSFSGQAQREIVTGLAASKNSSTTAALSATLHSSVLALTDAFWHYVNSNIVGEVNKAQKPKFTISPDNRVSIPLVQVQCQSYNLGVALRQKSPLSFETGAMVNDFSKSASNAYSWVKWNVPDGAWNFAHPQPWDMTNVTWIDTSEIKGTRGEPLLSSLAAVVTVPAVWPVSNASGINGYQQGSVITPCVIDARWAMTDVTFDITEPVVKTSLTTWLDETNLIKGDVDVKTALSKWKISDPISISRDWASTINAPPFDGGNLMEQILEQFESPFSSDERLVSFYPSSSSDEPWQKVYANSIAIVLSTVMADWISRTSQSGTDFTTVLSTVKDGNVSAIDLVSQRTTAIGSAQVSIFDDQTGIVYTVQRYGWGYGLKSKTIWFSIISLLIHVVLVVVYFIYSFVFWYRANGWTSKSWGTIGELVALAALSPPADEFRNSGGGINNSGTWMTAMRVREAGSDSDRLELVVGTRDGTVVPDDNKLKIDKVYS